MLDKHLSFKKYGTKCYKNEFSCHVFFLIFWRLKHRLNKELHSSEEKKLVCGPRKGGEMFSTKEIIIRASFYYHESHLITENIPNDSYCQYSSINTYTLNEIPKLVHGDTAILVIKRCTHKEK